MSVHQVRIVEAESGQLVEAELHDELSAETLLDIEDQWASSRAVLRQRLGVASIPRVRWPQSLHWDWSRKSLHVTFADDRDNYRIFGIRRQAMWEGAMVTQRRGWHAKLAPDAGKCLIYVDYLETAPWNWTVTQVGLARKYKAVGPLLFRAAVEQSCAEGNDGRIGLHALPQAEDFYKGQGLSLVLHDMEKRLSYYELTAAGAAILRKG